LLQVRVALCRRDIALVAARVACERHISGGWESKQQKIFTVSHFLNHCNNPAMASIGPRR
jgi:hypothetical protein